MAEAGARFEYISGIWQSVADRGRALVGYRRPAPLDPQALIELARKLISGRGETSAVAAAATLLAGFAALDEADKRAFLNGASDAFGPDLEALQAVARAFL
jgi:malonyl-CoA decarboxylase